MARLQVKRWRSSSYFFHPEICELLCQKVKLQIPKWHNPGGLHPRCNWPSPTRHAENVSWAIINVPLASDFLLWIPGIWFPDVLRTEPGICVKNTLYSLWQRNNWQQAAGNTLIICNKPTVTLTSPVWILPLSADWYLLLATPIPVHNLCGHSKMLPSELLCQAGSKEKQVSTFNRHLQQWIRLSGWHSISAKKLQGAYDTLLNQNLCNKYKKNRFCF